MSDLSISSSLLAATLNASLVGSVINAIHTADLTSAAEAGSGAAQASVTRSPRQASPVAVQRTLYVRNCEKPAATFEPRPVHHWHTRLNEVQPCNGDRPIPPTGCKSSIQPPWRVLPWPIAAKPTFPPGHRVIKMQSKRTDVDNVGRTLDLFV